MNVKPTAGAASIALLLLLAGCGGPRPQLLDATQQALAAVRSDQLTFRLLDQRRLPAATADVVLQDMTDELTAAEKATAQVAASSDIDRRDRDDVLKAIRAAVSAALSSEYCLDRAAVCTRAGQELASVAEQLDALVASLEAGR
ncbi:MAG TPA: hypothetical protein VFP89_00870 [Propionibacteriaceae bacterium]|nr:hypothetical protein [Propionibacteriaceae bacterium]